mgnify:CR=1 FL=1
MQGVEGRYPTLTLSESASEASGTPREPRKRQ